MTRHVCYISGTRADFGLMQSTLVALAQTPGMRLDVLATGMHLSKAHGYTVDEIRSAGLTVRAEIAVPLEPSTGATMAKNIGTMIQQFVEQLERSRPDFVMLLGDRGEMLAGAIAAIHLNLPVVHIHGGERSGTVDEPVRHAISKLSHYHFVSTEASRQRLIQMGEAAANVFVTGAPGLDGLATLATHSRSELCASLAFDESRPVALVVFHPVLQEAERAGEVAKMILSCLALRQCQVVAMMPNSDAGGDRVGAVLSAGGTDPDVRVLTHLPRPTFVSWMACCDLMVGNSSAGIIEAASFGTPVLNVGGRQNLRERNANTLDVAADEREMLSAIDHLLVQGRYPAANVYGEGHAGERIVHLLATLPINAELVCKTNVY